MSNQLIQKYNVAGPRYTRYPSVPYWNTNLFSVENYKEKLVTSFESSNKEEGISLYILYRFAKVFALFADAINALPKGMKWNLHISPQY